jgi:tRNA-specific adenosine deaminase 2
MNATNRTYNGTRHAEFMAISAILSQNRTVPVSEPGGGGYQTRNESEDHEARGNGIEVGVARKGKMYSPEILRECDLYVTVEPCIMCASLLRQFGVRKVYYGASNEKFGGTGGVLFIHRGNGRAVVEEEGEENNEVDGGAVGMEGKEVGRKGKESGKEEREEGDYEVSGGWLRDEAVLMLQRFYMQENERAPEPKARGKKGAVLAGVEVGVEGGKEGDG